MGLLYDVYHEQKYLSLFKVLLKKILSRKSVGPIYKEQKAVFILSTGRVGTKTLAKILSESSKVISFHESTPELYSLSKELFYIDDYGTKKIISKVFDLVREDHLKFAEIIGKKYVETSPQNTFLAPAIKLALPNTKFIHLIRKPEDVIISGLNRGWYGGHSYDEYRIKPPNNSEFYEKWAHFSLTEKNMWLWSATNEWILNYLTELNGEGYLRIRSEDLFNYNKKELHAILRKIDITDISEATIRKVLGRKLNDNKNSKFKHLNTEGLDKELLEYYDKIKSIFYSI